MPGNGERAHGRAEVVYDPGLQLERTLLAYRRTCLSAALAGATAIRLLIAHHVVALTLGLVCVTLAVVSWISATWRYQLAHRRLQGAGSTGATGLPQALIAAAVGVAAASVLWVSAYRAILSMA